jgi:hypothetical protein
LFSFVTQNWRGKPLTTLKVIVELIANTRTTKGLIVKAALDPNEYLSGKKVSDHELCTLGEIIDYFVETDLCRKGRGPRQ